MIILDHVGDEPALFGRRRLLLDRADLLLPTGRYALLSHHPEYHRSLIDILAGLRPPRRGRVVHHGLTSWPIGRQAFVRGKTSGLKMLEFICGFYGLDTDVTTALVRDLMTEGNRLEDAISDWPMWVRQEFGFALALAPPFDVYVFDGVLPYEPCRFTRLWHALFEEIVVGKTLILATYRRNQISDHCTKGLIHDGRRFRIDDDLTGCVDRYPLRQSRSDGAEGAGVGEGAAPYPL